MGLRFVLFTTFLFAVLALLNFYAFRWSKRAFRLSNRGQRILGAVLVLAPVGLVGGRFAGRLGASELSRDVVSVASITQLAIVVSVFLLFAADAAFAAGKIVGRLTRARRTAEPPKGSETTAATLASPTAPEATAETLAPPTAPEIPRRQFLEGAVAGSAFLIGGSSALYGALSGRHDYSIEDVPVAIPGLSRALDGFTIVQLSDVHIGQFVGDAELAAAEDLVRRARPDVIVLTGDLLDNDARLADRLGRFVRRLTPLAREGVVAISGNHDFYAGISETEAAITAGGGRMLRNRGLVMGDAGAGFALLGVDDMWGARFGYGQGPDLEKAVRSLPALAGKIAPARDLPRLLLCHNPIYFESAAGEVALQLSGHTHGGQVNFIVRPADWVLKNGWVAGFYERNGSRLYVNRGFGTVGPPARIGAPPEVTRVVLTA